MNHIFKTLILMLAVAMPLLSFSQKGIIRGQVIDGETGEPLFSANAVLKGTTIGATTDFDGKFELQAEEGTYDLEVTFIGMAGMSITGLEIKSGDVTVVEAISLKPASNELGEVVITAAATRNTAAALMTLKKKSTNVIDGISAGELRKTGDSDAGDAAKRVTGVSVEGGKYVYVRGIGDRYTKTMLNGVDIPGLDPDRNAIQIDIFPTSLIDNMTILKSSLAELPADFTGGLVNIELKDFPEQPVFDVSAGLGYTPSMHFNSDYLAYEGGKTDFLAFDDGTRALPADGDLDPAPNPVDPQFSDQDVYNFVSDFSPVLGAMKQQSFMDFDLGVSAGNQKALESGNKIGYIFSLTYKNSTKYYEEAEFGEYVRPGSPDDYEMEYTTTRKGSYGDNNVLLGGVAGLAYKTQKSKYQFTVLHLQNGETQAGQFEIDNSGTAVGQSGYQAFSNNLAYSQRAITNALLSGEHHTLDDKWTVEWKVSPTFSKIDEPDLRTTSFTITPQGDSIFSPGAGGTPGRSWRYLDEISAVAQLNLIREFKLFEKNAKLKFGASNVYKRRNYEILTFNLQSFGGQPEFSGDPNQVLIDENIYNNGPLYYTAGQGVPNANEYSSNANNTAVYVSQEASLSDRLKAVVGLRAEYFVQKHTGRDQAGAIGISSGQGGGNVLDNGKVLDALDLFPSANLIFAVDENENLRFSYFRSIARPSFKELSFAQIQDPITNRAFNGGLIPYAGSWDGNLNETRINNFDLRWEMFMKPGELLSFSGFVKLFDNAIELVRIPEAATTAEFQPRNVGNGQVFGAEVEFRKNLGFISPVVDKLSFSGNFTYVYSQITMTDVEREARENYVKTGQTIGDKRAMAGQAPYIVNAGISFDNVEKRFNAGIYYNVKGRTLDVVGGGLFPDVYTELFHSLNFTARKAFGEDGRSAVSFKVNNLLNDIVESHYVSYEAQDQIFSKISPGVQFSIGYTYKFK